MECLQKALLDKRHHYERKTSIPHTEKKRDDSIGGSGALELQEEKYVLRNWTSLCRKL